MSIPGVVAALALLFAVGIVAYPLFVKAVTDGQMRVLLSDTKSWADRVEYFRAGDGSLPPPGQLAGQLAGRPGLLEKANVMTVWPDCRFVGDGPEVTPSVGEFILVGSFQGDSVSGRLNAPAVVFDSIRQTYREYKAPPGDGSGCSTAAGGEGAVIATVDGDPPAVRVTAR